MGPQAKIISCNTDGEAICASAARISTTSGDAVEIFENARGSEKNRTLIEKVLKSGHKSTLEHAVFTIALRDVSVLAEQFFIEHRLASFTVKSRRYVDFTGQGYYIPPDLKGDVLAAYQSYMGPLFDTYHSLLEDGVPKEDARFLLPYAFHSNFYCTVNARELAHMIRAMRYGRGRNFPEFQLLAEQLEIQLEDLFPSLLCELAGSSDGVEVTVPPCLEGPPVLLSQGEAGRVQLVDAPETPLELLRAAHRVQNTGGEFDLAALLRSPRPRELEQLAYTFLLSGVTLSGVTHVVRHRMQSVIVPPIESLDYSRVILPETVAGNPAARERYCNAVEIACGTRARLFRDPQLVKYRAYFALSGCVMDLMTTINARELRHFIQLRTCSRAQWEIRGIAEAMLEQLRESFPALFGRFGPSCFMQGRCPEGAMTCGGMERMAAKYGGT